MWTTRPQVKGGYIEVSRAPGFGIELDAEMLRRYRVS
jgi:L-alanine-DL-glutamate epimerase-like enolase superfamily enzyme